MSFEDKFNLGQGLLDMRVEFQTMGQDWLLEILEEFKTEHELEVVPAYVEAKLREMLEDLMDRIADIWGSPDFQARFDRLTHDFMDEYNRRKSE